MIALRLPLGQTEVPKVHNNSDLLCTFAVRTGGSRDPAVGQEFVLDRHADIRHVAGGDHTEDLASCRRVATDDARPGLGQVF